jgi:hypothetical protein
VLTRAKDDDIVTINGGDDADMGRKVSAMFAAKCWRASILTRLRSLQTQTVLRSTT